MVSLYMVVLMGKFVYFHLTSCSFSHKILWLKVSGSNNDPNIISSFFLNCVEELNGMCITRAHN